MRGMPLGARPTAAPAPAPPLRVPPLGASEGAQDRRTADGEGGAGGLFPAVPARRYRSPVLRLVLGAVTEAVGVDDPLVRAAVVDGGSPVEGDERGIVVQVSAGVDEEVTADAVQ